MSSNNPFNAGYLYTNNNNNNSTTTTATTTNTHNKVKRESTAATSLVNFHERVQKVEKHQGRTTPLLTLTGRITPLSNSYKVLSVHLVGSNDKPGSANSSTQAASNVDKNSISSSVKKETCSSVASTGSADFPFLSCSANNKDSKQLPFERPKSKQQFYHLPKALDQVRPHLPGNPLEVRSRNGSSYETSNHPSPLKHEDDIPTPCSVFGDDDKSDMGAFSRCVFVIIVIIDSWNSFCQFL